MMRFLTAGESHGQALVVIVEGFPAGIEIRLDEIEKELARRRIGFGRGPRMRIERDEVQILSGVRHLSTLGSPIAIEIANSEWPKWEQEMSPGPGFPSKKLTAPRPGHADLSGMLKYGLDDARDVLERASARETAARVAAGTLAKKLLSLFGIQIISHVVVLGDVSVADLQDQRTLPLPSDLEAIDASEVRCFYPEYGESMILQIKAASKQGDSLGGACQVIAYGVPVGLGSYVHWDRRLDGKIAQALMSIQAIKAVSIGSGVEVASRLGSQAHDPISIKAKQDRTTMQGNSHVGRNILGPSADRDLDTLDLSYKSGGFVRASNLAGGIEGGISTGDPILATLWMKPLATLNRPVLATVDLETKQEALSFKERTDVTAVPAMGVVAESMMALTICEEMISKFGGDSLVEMKRNYDSYLKAIQL